MMQTEQKWEKNAIKHDFLMTLTKIKKIFIGENASIRTEIIHRKV